MKISYLMDLTNQLSLFEFLNKLIVNANAPVLWKRLVDTGLELQTMPLEVTHSYAYPLLYLNICNVRRCDALSGTLAHSDIWRYFGKAHMNDSIMLIHRDTPFLNSRQRQCHHPQPINYREDEIIGKASFHLESTLKNSFRNTANLFFARKFNFF